MKIKFLLLTLILLLIILAANLSADSFVGELNTPSQGGLEKSSSQHLDELCEEDFNIESNRVLNTPMFPKDGSDINFEENGSEDFFYEMAPLEFDVFLDNERLNPVAHPFIVGNILDLRFTLDSSKFEHVSFCFDSDLDPFTDNNLLVIEGISLEENCLGSSFEWYTSKILPGSEGYVCLRVESDKGCKYFYSLEKISFRKQNPDINLDGIVNLEDFSLLSNSWFSSCSGPDWCNGADIDSSGSVDSFDLIILCENWMKSFESLLENDLLGLEDSRQSIDVPNNWTLVRLPYNFILNYDSDDVDETFEDRSSLD